MSRRGQQQPAAEQEHDDTGDGGEPRREAASLRTEAERRERERESEKRDGEARESEPHVAVAAPGGPISARISSAVSVWSLRLARSNTAFAAASSPPS